MHAAAPGRAALRWRVRRLAAPGRGAAAAPPSSRRQLDQLAGDAGAGSFDPGVAGQVGRQLDERVVAADVDVPEVLAGQAALVGDGADDLARLDLVPLADRDPVRRHRDVGAPARPRAGARRAPGAPCRGSGRGRRSSARSWRAGRSASGSSSSGVSPCATTASAAATSTSGTSCSLHVVGDDVAEPVDPRGLARAPR